MPDAASIREPVLSVRDLSKHFALHKGGFLFGGTQILRAVDGISFDLYPGETLGVVGESGCGKSTMARNVLRLQDATGGEVLYNNRNILDLPAAQLRQIRRDMQIIFQDPYASLNPRFSVRQIVSEPWDIFPDILGTDDRDARVAELLERVGLNASDASRYPHQFSGGQRQRIGIARALAVRPKVIVCDEAVSALDVSVQAQVVNLLMELQRDFGLSYIFISHDLSVVRHISDRVAVMYLGKIVEIGGWEEIYSAPTHPYSQALLSAVPEPAARTSGRGRRRIILKGDVPNPANPPSGCRFRTRCWKAQDICAQQEPPLQPRSGPGHLSACHFAEPLNSGST